MLTSAAGYVVPMAINFISTPLLLYWLGEAGYGLQNLVGVVIGYLTIMNLGLDIPIVKFVAEDHARGDSEAENRLLSTTLQLYLVVGVVGMVVIALAADMLARRVFVMPAELIEPARMVFMLAGVGFLASVFTSWGQAVANGLQRYDISNSVSITTSVVGTVIGLWAVYSGYGVVGYVLVRVASYLLSGWVYWLAVHRLLPSFRLQFGVDLAVLRRVRSYVGLGFLLRLSGLLGTSLDRTLIGVWVGMAAVGVYAVPFLLVNSVGYLIANMFHFTFPMASELSSTNHLDELRTIYTRATRFIAGLASVVFPLLLGLGDLFLILWVGSGTTMQAVSVFRLLLLAGYIGTLAVTLTNNLVVGSGHIRAFTVYALSRAGMVSLGYVLLIRPFGIEGAGLALLLGSIVEVVFLLFTLRHYLQIAVSTFFRDAYLRPLLMGAGLFGLAFLSRPLATSWVGLIGVVGFLSLLYIATGFWVGLFGESEKRAVIGLWQIVAQQVKNAKRLV
jgi:O-antigen/teichoic acid export membrane protein